MPNYQYRCENGHEMERIEDIGLDTRPECHECKPRAVTCDDPDVPDGCQCAVLHLEPVRMSRVFGKTSFSFKGGAPTRKFHRRG